MKFSVQTIQCTYRTEQKIFLFAHVHLRVLFRRGTGWFMAASQRKKQKSNTHQRSFPATYLHYSRVSVLKRGAAATGGGCHPGWCRRGARGGSTSRRRGGTADSHPAVTVKTATLVSPPLPGVPRLHIIAKEGYPKKGIPFCARTLAASTRSMISPAHLIKPMAAASNHPSTWPDVASSMHGFPFPELTSCRYCQLAVAVGVSHVDLYFIVQSRTLLCTRPAPLGGFGCFYVSTSGSVCVPQAPGHASVQGAGNVIASFLFKLVLVAWTHKQQCLYIAVDFCGGSSALFLYFDPRTYCT